MNEKPKYTVEGHRKATLRASLRGLISVYLVYLGWSVARDSGGDSPIKPWMGWGIFVIFAAIAAAFGLYAYKQYKLDLKDAEAPAEETPPEEIDDGEEEP